MEAEQLISTVNEISKALIGLETFVWERFFEEKVQLKDVEGLQGIISAVSFLATPNAVDLNEFIESLENKQELKAGTAND